MSQLEDRVPIAQVADLLQVGHAVPFRVLDEHGRLLLNEGQMIGSARLFDLLVERGAWVERWLVKAVRERLQPQGRVPGTVQRRATLFDRWDHAIWDLDAVLRRTLSGAPSAAEWGVRIDELLALTDRDADIALFLAVRQQDRRFALYPLSHALRSALLALLTVRQAGWDAARQRTVVGAALSMNVAMIELQAQMAEQGTPPTAAQLAVIRAHPQRGAQLLQAAGVADAAWLQAVEQHHEHADGRGYPGGLTDVADEARVLRMADVYMAKITPRASRPPLAPLLASRQLFQQEAGAPLATALIKALGVHPPGALVQLKSGEVAVVKRRAGVGGGLQVCTLSDRHGKPSVNAQVFDAADPAHAVTGPCADPAPFARVLPERVYGLVDP